MSRYSSADTFARPCSARSSMRASAMTVSSLALVEVKSFVDMACLSTVATGGDEPVLAGVCVRFKAGASADGVETPSDGLSLERCARGNRELHHAAGAPARRNAANRCCGVPFGGG